jgi:2-polyprenyl-3-methyl-5-hydroxy-6-metoxy-1,4-benzoquinol methylase
MSTKYRDVLYSNYHSTQSGRASLTDAKSLFEREKLRFQMELLPLMNSVSKSARIFDMGCGSGSLLSVLGDAGFENAFGMDLSQEQVDLAHKMGVNQVQLGNALDFIKNSGEQFDVITGTDIIEHFTKDELVELLQTIQSKLKPGGKAIFRTPNLDAPFASIFANGDFTHENYLNASSAQQVHLACGFNKVNVYPSKMNIQNPIKEILRKCIAAPVFLSYKLSIFASGRSTQNVLFSPNMIIVAEN